ncbi:hypothetical protein [Aeoliella sp. SH292]|uniref:hypothetical protein n=1 Tax=Aeoliella sp. SH292 TaxID=3454464 RepID=UPI003F9A28B5
MIVLDQGAPILSGYRSQRPRCTDILGATPQVLAVAYSIRIRDGQKRGNNRREADLPRLSHEQLE